MSGGTNGKGVILDIISSLHLRELFYLPDENNGGGLGHVNSIHRLHILQPCSHHHPLQPKNIDMALPLMLARQGREYISTDGQ